MILSEIEVVLNVSFGGFHIDDEMAMWLMENKGWKIGKDENSEELDLVELTKDYFYPTKKYEKDKYDDISIRTNPDLIECVKSLQEKLKDIPYSKRYEHQALNLSVKKFKVELGINNYYDGKEKAEISIIEA